MKFFLSLKKFFLPLGGCLAGALILNNTMLSIPESLLCTYEYSDPELILWVKVWGRLLFSSFATLLLILASMKFEILKVIRWVFILATAMIYLFFFHLVPEWVQSLPNEAIPAQDQNFVTIIIRNGIPVSFFLLSSYWPSTIILFIYSFANRYLNLTETFFIYPIFAILGIIIPILFNPTLPISTPLPSLESTLHTGYISIFLTLICLLFFEWIARNNPFPEEESSKEPSLDKKKLFIQGALVLMTAFLYQLNKSVWFSQGSLEYPAPQEYTHFLTSFEGLRSLGMLSDVVFLLFVLIALEKRSGRAWKNIFAGIVLVSTSIGLSLIVYNVFSKGLLNQTLIPKDITIKSFFEGGAIGSGYQIFFTAVSYPILLCLKEMTFQIHPPKKRFTAKLFIDLIFAKAGLLLATFASLIGSPMPLFLRLSLFSAILLIVGILWLYSVYKIGNRIEELSPVATL